MFVFANLGKIEPNRPKQVRKWTFSNFSGDNNVHKATSVCSAMFQHNFATLILRLDTETKRSTIFSGSTIISADDEYTHH